MAATDLAERVDRETGELLAEEPYRFPEVRIDKKFVMLQQGLCECGCGRPAPISKRSHARLGYVKGQPKRFIRGHATRKPGPDWLEEDRGYLTPCWVWQRYVNPGTGYGSTGKNSAHRAVYERQVGRVPRGLELDHLCRVRSCVNPAHLEVVDRSENNRRGALMAMLTKLTPQQKYEVMRSTERRSVVAARYGISPYYVSELRAGGGPFPRAGKVSSDGLRDLKARAAAGETPGALAEAFGLTRNYVYRLLRGDVRQSGLEVAP